MRSIFLLIALVFSTGWAKGQNLDRVRFDDYVYVDNISTVQFFLDGLIYSIPLVELGNPASLVLAWDDLDNDVKDFTYTIVHCDRNWQPSNLQQIEYLNGFPESDVPRPAFSYKTLAEYTHYELVLPNEDMIWTLSGNYLLVVYEDEYDKIPVITRRFVVVDRKVGVNAAMQRPTSVKKIQTHQEIDFLVDHERFDIRNPLTEVTATVLQNRRWDNAIYNIKPKFIRPGQKLLFDYQDFIVFPGGKEFRSLDLRSFRRPLDEFIIEQVGDQYNINLAPDPERYREPHLNYIDNNGAIVMDNRDQGDPFLAGDYGDVLFQFKPSEPYFDRDVYLIGGFSDYTPLEKFKMTYNPAVNAYVTRLYLKQGYYDYYYATLPSGEDIERYPKFDISITEGNSNQTENMYTILIYYRSFAGRYDELIGSYQISSNE